MDEVTPAPDGEQILPPSLMSTVVMLVMSCVIAAVGYAGYRLMTRGERGSGVAALTTIAGAEG